ncbi:MAG: hypothetical protein HFJ54_07800 [Clostridia bacterium]|nr:hypothetical protein [Clostridia bacterium]
MQKFGDYVKYEPDNGTFRMTDVEPTTRETYAQLGGVEQETVYGKVNVTTEQFDWRIFEIDEDKDRLTIIADGVTKEIVGLKGAQGYNNGVGIINKICETCYSKTSKNAKGRSINFLDIKDKNEYNLISDEETYIGEAYQDYNYYPTAFMYDEYSIVDGKINYPGGQSSAGEKAWNNSEQRFFLSGTLTRIKI